MRDSTPAVDFDVEELVDRAREGDHAAFEQLVARYQDRIYNYVSRMVRDTTEAQDVAQETFVRVYRSLPYFRGAARFQTWLYRIASNLAIDAARSRKRRQTNTVSLSEPIEGHDDSELERDLPDETRGAPHEEAQRAELRRQVWEAMSELPPKLRMVVALYDLEGLSYHEIAEIMGCPLGTVKSRLFNARTRLREKLRKRLSLEAVVD